MIKIKKLLIKSDSKTLVDLAFNIENSLALVGQSGSGKSLTLKALLGMLPQNLKLTLDIESNFKLVAGDSLAFVPQNPFSSLSPLTKIKKHFLVSAQKQIELLDSVSLSSELLNRFPPDLSGGQLQRIIIAIALENNPKLLMLDEPTTALDSITTDKILNLLKELSVKNGFKILFVTHDINSAKKLCEDICVIKDGKVVENGKMSKVLQNPKELYTKQLIEANFANRKFRK